MKELIEEENAGPSAPQEFDIWETAEGIFVYIKGETRQAFTLLELEERERKAWTASRRIKYKPMLGAPEAMMAIDQFESFEDYKNSEDY